MANENLTQQASSVGLDLGDNAQIAQMLQGGQLGVGIDAPNIDAATPLILPPAVCVVMQTPTMYTGGADGEHRDVFARMLKSLIESNAKSVTGIDFEYTLETQDQPIGHDGQMLAVPTQTKRSAVAPSFVFPEVTGSLVWNLFTQWIKDIQHPDTNQAFTGLTTDRVYMSSAYSMSMLVIQFDATHKPENIIDAGLITNMYPTTCGAFGIERQIGQSNVKERSVNFVGHLQHNKTTRQLGIDVATQLQLAKVNYNVAGSGVTDVNTLLANTGLVEEAASIIANA